MQGHRKGLTSDLKKQHHNYYKIIDRGEAIVEALRQINDDRPHLTQ